MLDERDYMAKKKEDGGDVFDKALNEKGAVIDKPRQHSNAIRILAWRCPSCNRVNIAKRSVPHSDKCNQCDKLTEIHITLMQAATAAVATK
jgi:uncharacterized protein (DUF983 family)